MAIRNSIASLEELILERAKLMLDLQAKNTRDGYRFDFADFTAFCKRVGEKDLPASSVTVSLYITDMVSTRGLKASTAARRLSAVAHKHRSNNLPCPVTPDNRALVRAAKRLHADMLRQVRPLSVEQVRKISNAMSARGTPIAMRNRALVVMGFASALRSANLASLLLKDAEFAEEGLVLHIRREKQDQHRNEPRLIGIPHGKHPETCAATCLKEWILRRGSWDGPLFTRFNRGALLEKAPLEPQRICQLVQACVASIGLDPRFFGSHSMRSGFITTAGQANVGNLNIAHHTGHKDLAIMARYFRRQEVFSGNPCDLMDL